MKDTGGVDLSRLRGLHPRLAELPDITLRQLALYEDLLRKWQGSINLVAKSTLDDIWIRHFVDSLQVSAAAPEARRWVDLGSGGGFPGLVTAIRYADDPSAEIHLIESDQRKCAFLRTVSRETGAHAIVHCGRIEDIAAALDVPFDAVSARALAPFSQLLHYAERFLEKGAVGVFSKGEQAEAELTGLSAAARYQIAGMASETSDSARLIIVRRRVD